MRKTNQISQEKTIKIEINIKNLGVPVTMKSHLSNLSHRNDYSTLSVYNFSDTQK